MKLLAKKSGLQGTGTKRTGRPVAGLRERFARGVGALSKSFGVTSGGDYGWNQLVGMSRQYYAGSEIDWQQAAGNILDNPALSICLGYVFDKVAEPRLQVVEDQDDDRRKRFPGIRCSRCCGSPTRNIPGARCPGGKPLL